MRFALPALVLLAFVAGWWVAVSSGLLPAPPGDRPAAVGHDRPPTPAPNGPTPSPTTAALPSPSEIPEFAKGILALLSERDGHALSGKLERVAPLLDQSAPAAFRDRQLELARVEFERSAAVPDRRFLALGGGLGSAEGLLRLEVAETDDQGRVRRIRYWANSAGTLRLSEPHVDRLGALQTISTESFDISFYEVDRPQALVAQRIATEAIEELVRVLGPEYRAARRLVITLSPVTVPSLPAVASGFVNEDGITLLSSASMIVAEGPGATWARTVLEHEIAHVLLFQRGTGPWLLVEGIPLWLTDDRRQPQLDRLVANGALWELDHLVGGPRTPAEFFVAYAQASSFVRYLAATYGERKVIELWELGRTSRFAEGFESVFGVPATTAYASWRASLPREMTRYPRMDGERLALAPIT